MMKQQDPRGHGRLDRVTTKSIEYCNEFRCGKDCLSVIPKPEFAREMKNDAPLILENLPGSFPFPPSAFLPPCP